MLDRRGQGLPLNTIIISIIVVVVLVVIILIFTGNIGNTNTTMKSCAANGGECKTSTACTNEEGRVITGTCTVDTHVCCLTI